MKPKAPRWLTEAFRDGIDERVASELQVAECQLAQHDPLERPCSGRLERFHYVNRQRIENAMGALLPAAELWPLYGGLTPSWPEIRPEVILLAGWDPRVGGIACEVHHRRLDSALTPPLIVPYDALPDHVIDWASDYGLESPLEARYPSEVASV